MKKTLISSLLTLSLAASAGAVTTTFSSLPTTGTKDVGNVTYTAPATGSTLGIITDKAGVTDSDLYTTVVKSDLAYTQYATSLTFVLNVSALSKLTTEDSEVKIFCFDEGTAGSYGNNDMGLWATNEGGTIKLRYGFNSTAWDASGKPEYTLSDLSTFSLSGSTDKLVSLTATYQPIFTGTSTTKGMQLYTASSTTSLMNGSALGASGANISFNRIEIDTRYISAFAVSDNILSATDAQAAAAALQKAVPEPATATLSLLALAGLAARRRRK